LPEISSPRSLSAPSPIVAIIALDDSVAVEAHDLVEKLGAEAVHYAHHDDQRRDAERNREQADARDEEDEALALLRQQVTPGEHPLGSVEDHAVSLASALSMLSSSRSPVERRFNSTVPEAIPRGPTINCQGNPIRSMEPSLTPPRSSRSSYSVPTPAPRSCS